MGASIYVGYRVEVSERQLEELDKIAMECGYGAHGVKSSKVQRLARVKRLLRDQGQNVLGLIPDGVKTQSAAQTS